MKKLLLLLFGGISLLAAQPSLNINKVSSELELEILEHPDDMLVVSLLLADRADMLALDAEIRRKKGTLSDRSYLTITSLKAKAEATQGPLLAFLQGHRLVDQASIKPFWINNVIFARVHPDLIPELSQRADIEWIDKDYQNATTAYEKVGKAPAMIPGGREAGIDAIRAPLLWKLGYTGKDRVVMSFDTGVDNGHPALADRWRANVVPQSWTWYDYNDTTNHTPDFCDAHGTHTVGTMVGIDPMTNDTVGVAPQGYWIGSSWCNNAGQAYNTAVFQWAMDPDGDPNTTFDMPDAINNSWGIPGMGGECNSYFVGLFQALETVGIAVVFAAGNDGPTPSTIGPPVNINHDTVDVFSVGNLNGNNPLYPINIESSRGPSICGGTGTLLIKPEVSAPGTNVRSTVLNGNYSLFTGTSMAAPHVAGAILLLKDAFPYLPSRDLKMALFKTARDLGTRGEDNSYGMGLIDVYTAYLELVAEGNVPNTGSPPALEVAVTSMLAPIEPALCEEGVAPAVRLKNYGTDTISTFSMATFYSNGLADTLHWTGSWAPATELDIQMDYQVLNPGSYLFTTNIYTVNGGIDFFDGNNNGRIEFMLLNEPILNAISDTVCAGEDVVLESQTDNPWEIQWYNQANGGFPFASGDQLVLPNLGTDSLLYIGSGLSGSMGLADTSQLNGGFDNSTDGELFFTLDGDANFYSVDILAQSAGLRILYLYKIFQGNSTVVFFKFLTLDAGLQTIELDEDLLFGSYMMTIEGGNGNLFHQSSGISYPLELPGFGRVTSASPASDAYYYFYKLRFQSESACPRKPVSITTQSVEAQAAFTLDNTSPDLPDNATIQFTDGSTNAQSWFWDFGDSTNSTDQNPQHSFTQPGTYAVSLTVTDANGCTDSSVDSITVTGFPSSIQPDLGLSFKVFPNPGVQQVFVEMDQSTGVDIEVWNVAGKRILAESMDASGKMTLNMGMVPDGIYLIVARDEARQFTQKWVKQAD